MKIGGSFEQTFAYFLLSRPVTMHQQLIVARKFRTGYKKLFFPSDYNRNKKGERSRALVLLTQAVCEAVFLKHT